MGPRILGSDRARVGALGAREAAEHREVARIALADMVRQRIAVKVRIVRVR